MIKSPQLTRREQDVLDQLKRGKRDRDIAVSLGIDVRTVETHMEGLRRKFNVSNRTELVLTALGMAIELDASVDPTA